MATKRTTHRSSAGKKLYAVRDKEGQFKDIQTYKKAHGQDIKRKSKAETAKKAQEEVAGRAACDRPRARRVVAPSAWPASLLGRDLEPAGGRAGEAVGAVHVLHRGRRMHEGARRHGAHDVGDRGLDDRLAALASSPPRRPRRPSELPKKSKAATKRSSRNSVCCGASVVLSQSRLLMSPESTRRGFSISRPAGRRSTSRMRPPVSVRPPSAPPPGGRSA